MTATFTRIDQIPEDIRVHHVDELPEHHRKSLYRLAGSDVGPRQRAELASELADEYTVIKHTDYFLVDVPLLGSPPGSEPTATANE